jgi:phage terminase large subunit-like protein
MPAEWLPAATTAADIDSLCAELSDSEAQALLYDWRGTWARAEQLLPPGDWANWVILAGRGFGKTRTGAEAIREVVSRDPNARVALVGPTAADCRDVMVEGESGLLNVFPPWERPEYESSKRRITFKNGAVGFLYSAEEPERLRGPQHSFAHCDEVAFYKEPEALWDNLKFGLRLGADPRVVVTTTPQPSKFLTSLITDKNTIVSRGSTFDNKANLPAGVLAEFLRVYGGTRIGRQELYGELLNEAEGALWRRAQLEECRRYRNQLPDLTRIVVAVDPAVTAGESSDETGIVVCGEDADGNGYVLADRSCRLPPDQWAAEVVKAYDEYEADRVIAESNNGGDLLESVLRTLRRNLPYKKVHASRGKVARAEPVAALYEQARIFHAGAFPALEDEQVTFVPGKLSRRSPNRVDALVWGMTFLLLGDRKHIGKAIWVT